MSRFYVPKESIKGGSVHISGKEAHHIIDVMRLKVSDEVIIFDGTGREYTGVVRDLGRKELVVEISQARAAAREDKHSVTLIQAIPKKDKMDYIAEKATELGVSCIIPVMTARTVPDWNEAKKVKAAERWRKISLEAAKQCGRSDIPEIAPVTDFTTAVHRHEKDSSTAAVNSLKLIAALSDKAIKLKEGLKGCAGGKITIAIGPEGDFTEEEIETALAEGFKIVNLGPRVLRSDTAGLAILSMINYEYSDR